MLIFKDGYINIFTNNFTYSDMEKHYQSLVENHLSKTDF